MSSSSPRETPRKINPFSYPSGDSCPIHKLNVEILAYLFEWVAFSKSLRSKPVMNEISGKVYMKVKRQLRGCSCPYRDDRDCQCDVDESPPWFPVSLVCRYWYDIATSTPSLWTNIVITYRTLPPFYRITKQLERSKNLPIDILIKHYDCPRSVIRSSCNLLLTKADRWRSLEVRARYLQNMYEVHNAIFESGTQINQLKSIVLYGHAPLDRSISSYGLSFVVFGCQAPHLNTIFLRWAGVDWNQGWICSASHLTNLEIETSHMFPSWAEFATILRGAPRLRVLALRNYRTDPAESPWVNPRLAGTIPVELPELKELDITLPVATVIQFLHRCYIPCLTKLALCLYYPTTGDHSERRERELEAIVEQLVAPLPHARTSRSSSHFRAPRSLLAGLEHLHLGSLENISAEHVNAMCSDMDQLTSLSLNGKGGLRFVDALFTPSGQTGDVKLPQLKNLAITSGYPHILDLEARQVFAFAWHRKDVGVPLRALSMWRLHGEVPMECLAWCEDNLEAFCFK